MSFAGRIFRKDRQGATQPPSHRSQVMFIFRRSTLGVLVALSIAAMPVLLAF
jgi:hypothetical protein